MRRRVARRLPAAGGQVLQALSGGGLLSPRQIDDLHRAHRPEPVQPRFADSDEQREEYWRRERARRGLRSWSA
jgi:hypothetical protein